MIEDPRLVRAWEEQSKLRRVLSELLEQIDMLDGIESIKHVGWDAAVEAARKAL